jgi:hypothetical protein
MIAHLLNDMEYYILMQCKSTVEYREVEEFLMKSWADRFL